MCQKRYPIRNWLSEIRFYLRFILPRRMIEFLRLKDSLFLTLRRWARVQKTLLGWQMRMASITGFFQRLLEWNQHLASSLLDALLSILLAGPRLLLLAVSIVFNLIARLPLLFRQHLVEEKLTVDFRKQKELPILPKYIVRYRRVNGLMTLFISWIN